jgi:hypothetical protein
MDDSAFLQHESMAPVGIANVIAVARGARSHAQGWARWQDAGRSRGIPMDACLWRLRMVLLMGAVALAAAIIAILLGKADGHDAFDSRLAMTAGQAPYAIMSRLE